MSKKSLIASLIVGAITTLSLGVYTLVSAIIALTTPHHSTQALAYTDTTLVNGVFEELVIGDFANYSEEEGTLEIKYEGEEKLLEYNADSRTYTLAKDSNGYTLAFGETAHAGDKVEFVAKATIDKYGSTITYNVAVYHQGTGASADDAYIVANAEGLKSVAADVDRDESALRLNKFVKVVEDVDMAGVEYSPIGKLRSYKGDFDGNGKTIKNLSIVINENNYKDYLRYNSDANRFVMYLGLFGWTGSQNTSAKIHGVAMSNATIKVEDTVLDELDGVITVGETSAKFGLLRAGLLVGDAYNTIVDGAYTYEVQKINEESGEPLVDEEQNPVMETKTGVATIAGSVCGLQYNAGFESIVNKSAFGGLVGVAETGAVTGAESAGLYTNYNVVVNMKTSDAQDYDWNGGVFGLVIGTSSHRIAAQDLKVVLNAETQFHQYKYVGGVAGYAGYLDAEAIEVSTSIVDADGATVQDLNAIVGVESYTSTSDAAKAFSEVSGVVARTYNSLYSNVKSTANIALWTKVSAGFVYAEDTTLENVTTSGVITGYNVSGLAHTTKNCEIGYQNTETEALVASNITLYGHDAVALVDYANNTNIKAEGSVKAVSDITAFGYRVVKTQKNNICHSSGLVGYFYSSDKVASNEYELSGFAVETTIKNGVDMAGVVAYLGQQDDATASPEVHYASVKVANISVEADFEAYSQADYTSAHKVGGAVATVYGNATLDHVDASVNFNKNHGAGSYGAAMFGGLVARVGGPVEITYCSTEGYAYINDTIYKITLSPASNPTELREFKQILAGGLVGAVARFTDVAFAPGTHPRYDVAVDGYAVGDTRDELLAVSASDIQITNNTANVDIDIAYVEQYDATANNAMYGGGYKARSAGSLIGLFLSEGTTALNTNHAYGVVNADHATFNVGTNLHGIVSTSGYGAYNAGSKTYANTTPVVVGCTSDLVNSGIYSALWGMPSVEEKPDVVA